VLAGKRRGRFASARTFPVGTGPRFVAITDLDRDGRQDMVVANRDSDDLSLLLNRPRDG
jgi:hypothetical protein